VSGVYCKIRVFTSASLILMGVYMFRSTLTKGGEPKPTPTCDGTTYDISTGETCEGVSMSAGISTLRLLLANNLGAFCSNFSTSGTLCIPRDATCTPYTIQRGDTCSSIAKYHEKTWIQIASWNPELGKDCQRIKRYIGLAMANGSIPGLSFGRRRLQQRRRECILTTYEQPEPLP